MSWANVVVRFVLYLDLMTAFGLAVFTLTGPRGCAEALPLRRAILATAIVGAALSALALALLAAEMAGVPIGEVDRETVDMLVYETAPGSAWLVRMAALAALALAALALPWRVATVVAAVAAGVALGTLAWTGHGAMDEGARGWVHLGADIVHLLAAGVWLGALAALLWLVLRPAAAMPGTHRNLCHAALHGFATTGTLTVAALLATGLVNGWIILGPPGIAALPDTLYGRLLLAKLALFVAMLGLAWLNRYRLTPALTQDGPRALRRSLAVETGSAIAIMALVAWLGTLAPDAA